MRKKILMSVLSVILALSVTAGLTATAQVQMTYLAVGDVCGLIDTSTGIVTIDADVEGYEGLTTDVSITINLQYYDTNKSKWVTLDTVWEDFYGEWYGEFYQQWYVSPGYSYRGNVYLTAYYFSIAEAIIMNTQTLVY
ncbi:MAG: hypothetical protein LBQ48_08080 [Oscillospiraceae bacterium]|jgi:hypothetical protein|nr:hypothetical protein [Oscillospiraceae bacterium]